jgi:rhodanese-related sulfurtransferase
MVLSPRLIRPVIGGSILVLLAVATSGDSITAKSLKSKLGRKTVPLIVDVRSRSEYLYGHIPGAIHIPFWSLLWRHAPIAQDQQRQTVIYCEHGPRAVLARALLSIVGKGDVALLEGHMSGWRRAGLPQRSGAK